MLKRILKKILSPSQIKLLREIRKLYYHNIVARLFSKDLTKLAMIYGSDKWGVHFYTPHYHEYFYKLRNKKINILEIGVGGYENPLKGGASLRMWKRYFPKGMIYSIDIYDKKAIEEKRIKIFQGSQIDEKFLKNVCERMGSLDIIIDDGSHINSHVITTFKYLFPLLKDGGIYVIEDTQTSYWPRRGKDEFGGDSENLNNPSTMMNFFKNLTDGLNYEEFLKPNYEPTYFDKHVVSIHFYHNLVFLHKGINSEGSNIVRNGRFK